jgi:hypothetical protein
MRAIEGNPYPTPARHRPRLCADPALAALRRRLPAIRRRGHCLTQTACRDTGLLKFGDAGTEFENIVIAKNVTLDRANAVLKKALKDGKVTRYGKQEWQVL